MAEPAIAKESLVSKFGPEHYVPLLLTKQGERTALSDMDATLKAAFTPLFVVPPIDWDYEAEAPSKEVGSHLANLPRQLFQCWEHRRAFLDLSQLDDSPMPDGGHPLYWTINEANQLGASLLPVVSCDNSTSYLDAAGSTIGRDHAGVCVRLPVTQWPSVTGEATLNNLMSSLGVTPREVDLVLDMADDLGPAAQALATAELNTLPQAFEWRSVSLLGASYPQTSPIGSGLHVVNREEWRIYREIIGGSQLPIRVPTFGDYVIASTNPVSDVDPRFMNISAQLRYTADASWLVSKGGLFKGNGGRSLGAAAVPPAAQAILDHPRFLGLNHCNFDNWLSSVANGSQSGGNPTVWRRFATQHHLQVVGEQIANLHEL